MAFPSILTPSKGSLKPEEVGWLLGRWSYGTERRDQESEVERKQSESKTWNVAGDCDTLLGVISCV